MPISSHFLDHRKNDFQQILQDSGTSQASVHLEQAGNFTLHKTFHGDGQGQSSSDAENEDTMIYMIGSITKLFVALLISIIIDELPYSPKEEHQKYRILRRGPKESLWNMTFTDLFNLFSDKDNQIQSLPRKPTLRHMLLHYNSLPPTNKDTLGPEGSTVMSKASFLRSAPRLAKAVYADSKQDYSSYSNGNYILIGFLIEVITKDDLAAVMKEHLFEPFGMLHSTMDPPKHGGISHYVVLADGTRQSVDTTLYSTESIMNAALGARSCLRDLAIFFRTLLQCMKDNKSVLKKETVNHFLMLNGKVDGVENFATTLCGIYTTLDTSVPGSRSINSLVSPGDISSNYRLGYTPDQKKISTYYATGATKGSNCCFYFVPKWKFFVIVLTDSNGRTDASDHISRYILQNTFDLSSSTSEMIRSVIKAEGSHLTDLKRKVNILDMSSRNADEGQKVLQRWAEEDAQKDIENCNPIELDGTYFNELTEQSIHIEGAEATIAGTAEGTISKPIGIIRTGQMEIRLKPLSTAFTIDRHDPYGWKELRFLLNTEKGPNGNHRVVCLTRNTMLSSDKFEWRNA